MMKTIEQICGNTRVQWTVGIVVNLTLALLTLALLSGCAPTPEKLWTPRQIDPSGHLFYMSPVVEAVDVNGIIIPAWDGNKASQVSILECSSTEARISDSVWVPRSNLLADWCDVEIYKRVKP